VRERERERERERRGGRRGMKSYYRFTQHGSRLLNYSMSVITRSNVRYCAKFHVIKGIKSVSFPVG
jgi:hypothetical protein